VKSERNNRNHGKGRLWQRLRIRIPFRFDKSAYLLILMLISVDFFHFTPISPLTTSDICLVLFLLWLLAAHFLYNPPEKYFGLTWKRSYWPLLLVWLGVLISFIPAYVLYGQTFFTSLIASRTMLAMLALPAIGTVRPKRIDLEKATVLFSFILIVFSILDALGIPVIDHHFFINEDKPYKELIEEDSFVMLLPGFQFVAVALFFFLDRLKNSFNLHDLIIALLLISAIFLLQNRTMLFISAALFAFTVLTIQGKSRKQTFMFRLLSIFLIVVMIVATVPHWVRLFTETAMQLGDNDYNRLLAYNYFLFQACPSFIYFFTGTGFISANTTSVMQDLMAAGIYNSDVGFIGLWNYYGVLPLIPIFAAIVFCFIGRKAYYVLFNAFFILAGSLTIACFDSMDKLLWLCLFLYMIRLGRLGKSSSLV
jgi:hypothetical protein